MLERRRRLVRREPERRHRGETRGDRLIDVSHVLLASGRVPNVEELSSRDASALEVGRGGIAVDDRQRTNVAGIWAAGDVAAGPVAHADRAVPGAHRGRGHVRRTAHGAPTIRCCRQRSSPTRSSAASASREAEAVEQGHDVGVVTHPLPSSRERSTRAQSTGSSRSSSIARRAGCSACTSSHARASDIVGSLAPALKLGVTVDDLALHAPRLSELQRRPEGRRREGAQIRRAKRSPNHRPEKVRSTFSRNMARGPGRRSGLSLCAPARRAGLRLRRKQAPRGSGPVGTASFEPHGCRPSLTLRCICFDAANDHEVDVVARLLRSDEIDEGLDGRNGPAVDLDDHVAARQASSRPRR